MERNKKIYFLIQKAVRNCMKVILIIFLVISMIVPAFKDDIQKKLPILLNIYLYTIPILLAYILISLHKIQ